MRAIDLPRFQSAMTHRTRSWGADADYFAVVRAYLPTPADLKATQKIPHIRGFDGITQPMLWIV